MCNSPRILISDDIRASAATAAALVFTPPADLNKRATENEQRIGVLEELIRAKKLELTRLRAHSEALFDNFQGSPHLVPPSPQPSLPIAAESSKTMHHHQNRKFPHTPEFALQHISAQLDSSPRGIMHSFDCPTAASNLSSPPEPSQIPDALGRQPTPIEEERLQMAARGSHWSFAEKERFEAALLRYGPFAWEEIIRAVATRTEKQVKAYAARYRRRKKLASHMQALFEEVSQQQNEQQDNHDACSQTETRQSEVMVVGDPPFELSQDPSLSETDDKSVESVGAETLLGVLGQHLGDPYAITSSPTYSSMSVLYPADVVEDNMIMSEKRSNDVVAMTPADSDLLIDRAIGGEDLIVEEDTVKTEQLVQISDDSMQADFLSSLFHP